MASIFKRKTGRHEPYVIQYFDHRGKRRTKVGFTDKGLTEELAAKLETEARLRRTGLIKVEDERLLVLQQAPLDEVLKAYEASLEKNTAKHVELTLYRVRRIVRGCGFGTLADIAREPVEMFLRELARTENLGHRTFNHYTQAIECFCNWCVATDRLVRNPLNGIERRNPATDVRHPRRALTPAEMSRLISGTRASGRKVQNLSAELRGRVYLFSYLTGLRKSEMASLCPESFQLGRSPATVTVEAAFSKHRRRDVLPLHPELAAELRGWLTGLGPREKLFPLLGKKKLSEMIQKDLHRAGIPYRTAEGIADFHAAGRHTYITQLLRSGASLPEARELARHSDIKTTMRYTHIGIQDQARAVANLPLPSAGTPDDRPTKPRRRQPRSRGPNPTSPAALHMRCSFGGAEGQPLTSRGNFAEQPSGRNPRPRKDFGSDSQALARPVKAEGTGLEPATGCPARHFQCRR